MQTLSHTTHYTEDWCIPEDMSEGDYLMMDPACEVNEKGTREKNDENKALEEEVNSPLDLDPNEIIKADEEKIGRTPNRKKFPKTCNQIYRLRYRQERVTGQDSRRSTTLTEMTSKWTG